MDPITIFNKNEEKADMLQEKHGLNMTLRDLYASELLTDSEAIQLQEFIDKTRPIPTGDFDADLKLQEAYQNETVAMNLTEAMITNPTAKQLYMRGSLDIREALELQRIRALRS